MSLKYWKSLEQLANTEEIQQKVSQEFPGYDPDEVTSPSRRRFMQLMGAAMALAGLTLDGCRRWPKQNLAPYSSQPRGIAAGVPEAYATAYELGGVAKPLLVTSYDGRPIKVEGNPSHPWSATFGGKLGSADVYAQASVLDLYDPHRSRNVVRTEGGKGQSATWEDLEKAIESLRADGGRGLAVLCEQSLSPTFLAVRQRAAAALPNVAWFEYEPLMATNETAAFGQPVRPVLAVDKADTIVSLDSDFLGSHPAHTRHANDWAKRRRSADTKGGMSRVYVVESALTITGAVADLRVPTKPSRISSIAAGLAALVAGGTIPRDLTQEETHFCYAAGADLKKGNGLVVAGPHMPREVHAMVFAMNAALGANGTRVTYVTAPASNAKSIADLATAIGNKSVTSLIALGGNPAYDAPADLNFAELIKSLANSIHLGDYYNETAVLTKWHAPKAHYLESWGDARAWDGTITIQQPLILPLFGGKTPAEFLAVLAGEKETAGQSLTRQTHQAMAERDWRRALEAGVVPNSAFPAFTGPVAQPATSSEPAAAASGYEVRFLQHQSIYDGRFANNAWLQETPDVISKLTWDNAALISKQDADALGITNGDVIDLTLGGKSLKIAAFIVPGQPVGVIGLPLGYGRDSVDWLPIAVRVGFDTYKLRSSNAMFVASGATAKKTGENYLLVSTIDHHLIDEIGFQGREVRIGKKYESGKIIREATYADYEKDPMAPHREIEKVVPLQIFEPPAKFNDPHAWGMSIDMATCIGCNACAVACQAENNVPVVGKEQVYNHRQMHWLRIDRYYKGSRDDTNPEVVFQPMMCVHCENAPCEQVCPVAATVHDTEGLNVMVYNRCIGTRYCSDNCPYKVRRFNYLDWHSLDPRGSRTFPKPWLGIPDTQQRDSVDQIKRMVYNPEVSVRMRGVMEKCTYCVQRIHNKQITERNQRGDNTIHDFEVVTACQQACPTEAIVFGDLKDENSLVRKLQAIPRSYSVLEDLNTRPRTKYLAKLRNPTETAAEPAKA